MFAQLDARLRLPEPTTKADDKKPEPPKKPDAQPPKEKTVPEFKMPKEFRENYEKTKVERDTLKTQLTELQTKISDYEKRGKDTEALLERVKTFEKKLDEKDSEIRALKQEASPEFKKNYDEPFERRAEFAKSQVERLQVIVKPADEMNEAVTRPAVWDDFRALYQMPPNQAIVEADRMFGKASSLVMGHITKLQEMDFERANALKAEKEQAKARQAEEDGKRVQQRQEFDATFKRVGDELAETVDGYKDADPTDKELADLRTQGYQIFDAQPANQQQLIVKGAHIRHRVAAYGPNMLTIQRLKKQVGELEAKVKELTPPPPGETRHPGGETITTSNESWEEGALKAVRAAPAI